MSTRPTPESGLRVDRIGCVREAVTGEIPADPNWEYHSDNYRTFTPSPDPGAERRDGLGTPYAVAHDVGNESHEITVAYDLQRPLVDQNGDPDDFAADGMQRTAGNEIPNTHAILTREDRGTPNPDDPADVSGARKYWVVKGAYPDPTIEGDPENGAPIPVEITYMAEKSRFYEILQMAAAELLAVRTTNANDTTQTLTVEGEDDTGTYTSEAIALDGDTLVSSSTSFQSIDAAELDVHTEGDVLVFINSGDATTPGEGSELVPGGIKGWDHYSADGQELEGDLGVPALENGSHGTEIGTSFEHFHGDTVERGGESLALDINNGTFEVDNGYEQTSREDSVRYRITEGNAEPTMTYEAIGDSLSHIQEGLTAAEADVVWEMAKTDLTLGSASAMTVPESGRESDQGAASITVEFEGTGADAVQMVNTV